MKYMFTLNGDQSDGNILILLLNAILFNYEIPFKQKHSPLTKAWVCKSCKGNDGSYDYSNTCVSGNHFI